MFKSKRPLLLMFFVIPLLSACPGGDDIGRNIGEAASKNFVEASKQFDAIGLKKLLDENEDLRRKLSEAQVLYQLSSGQGAINVGTQTLIFKVLDYSGDIRVSAMINGPAGRFINGDLLTSASVPKVPFDATRFFNDRFKGDSKWSYIQGSIDRCIDCERIDFVKGPDLLYKAVQAAFVEYQSKTRAVPQTSLPEYKLNERFSESGMNKLLVEVTPLSLTSDNKWHFRGALLLRNVNGTEAYLATFRADQLSHPDGLNKPARFEEPLRVLLSQNAALTPSIAASR